MNDDLVIQLPPGQPPQLMLLFHGVGSNPQSMVPLGQRLAQAFPQSAVVSVRGPQASDLGGGYQWFSVAGITEENRPARVAQAMPSFVAAVRGWQERTGVTAHATALVGFSQGAIMALESTQLDDALSTRTVALSGRFAGEPIAPPSGTTLHFIHGKSDGVMHYGHTVRAAERLISLGADVTADVLPNLGHQITDDVEALLLERLKGHVPQRIWQEAMRSVPRD